MHTLSTLLFATAALAAAVVEKRALPQGIDVSGYQPSVNWNTVKANGVTFAYIKATEGTSEYSQYHYSRLLKISPQPTRTRPSRASTREPQARASSVVLITLRTPIPPRVQPRPRSSSRTAVDGVEMASPSLVPSISSVSQCYPNIEKLRLKSCRQPQRRDLLRSERLCDGFLDC